MNGAYYPVGGPQQISRAIIPTIEAAGGRVFVKAAVSKILIEKGRAVGVAMRDGGEVCRAARARTTNSWPARDACTNRCHGALACSDALLTRPAHAPFPPPGPSTAAPRPHPDRAARNILSVQRRKGA